MLKFNFKKITLYLLIYSICSFLRPNFELIKYETNKDLSFIRIYVTFLGQIIGGLSVYFYQYRAFHKQSKNVYFGLELIHNKANMESKDKAFKIILLIILASSFEFFIVIIQYYLNIEGNIIISRVFTIRIQALTSIISSILCYYSLNYKLGKHHIFSIIFLGLFIILQIISEILYRPAGILLGQFFFQVFLMIMRNILISFIDCIEKYLYEANYVNPFKLLVLEGVFDIIFLLIFTFAKNTIDIKELKNFFAKLNSTQICVIAFVFIGYLIISTIIRVYQIYCNVIYSPTIKSIAGYILVPLYNIITYEVNVDFYGKIGYFAICEVISLILDFFGCVYNEFIILYCCGLEHDTKEDISFRARNIMNIPTNDIEFDDDFDGNTEILLN
jgi:hypothetical protein